MSNLQNIEALALKFENDELEIAKELKRVQSVKCRLKKQKGHSEYDNKMQEVLNYEQSLKEARQLLNPREKFVTEYMQEDVDKLDFDETVKAIKSIQSKKTLSRWLTTEEGNNDEFKNACRIEEMLVEHKKQVQPVDESYVRKSDLQTIIETIEDSGKLSNKKVLELLKGLL